MHISMMDWPVVIKNIATNIRFLLDEPFSGKIYKGTAINHYYTAKLYKKNVFEYMLKLYKNTYGFSLRLSIISDIYKNPATG